MRFFLLAVLCSTTAFANDFASTHIVTYSEFPPMVFEKDGDVQGFDVDLINLVFEDQGWSVPQFAKLLDKRKRFTTIVNGRADVLIGGVSITDEREEIVDFTTPYMDSGIQIVSKMDKTSFLTTLKSNKTVWKALIILLATLFIFGHIIWLCEQGTGSNGEDISGFIDDKYFPGIFDAMWYCWMVITTIGEGGITAHKWKGRAFAFVMSIIGLGIACSMLSEVATFKIQKAQAKYAGVMDLENKRIGIVGGTTTEELAEFIDATFIPYKECTELEQAINSGEVDAIAHDYPYIISVAKNNPEFGLVGDLIYAQDYGFAVAQQSPLREKITLSILKLIEDGTVDSLKVKWFGTK